MNKSPEELEFRKFYGSHYDFVWRSAVRLGVASADIDDVIQDTFWIALQRLDTFEGKSKHSTWLFAILRNVWRARQRTQRRRDRKHLAFATACEVEAGAEYTAMHRHVEEALGHRLLAEFVLELDLHKRTVFILVELEGMTSREVAEELGVNVNTVQSRLRAARAAFEERFGEDPRMVGLCDSLGQRPSRAPAESRRRNYTLLLAALSPPQATESSLASACSGRLMKRWSLRGSGT